MKKKKFNEVLYIKLPKELKEKMQQRADKKIKTTSEYVRDLIIKDLNEE